MSLAKIIKFMSSENKYKIIKKTLIIDNIKMLLKSRLTKKNVFDVTSMAAFFSFLQQLFSLKNDKNVFHYNLFRSI